MLGAAKLSQNNDSDKYSYSDMVFGLTHAQYFHSSTLRVKMFFHQCIVIAREKDILVLCKSPTQELDDNSTTEVKYSNNFTESGKTFVLSLYYNTSIH